MLRSIATLITLSILVLQVGCSGASSSTSSSNSFRESLGTTSQAQLQKSVEEIILRKYQYQFERTNYSSEDVYLETRWRDEVALEDERAQGYSFSRTRIIITARPRNRTTGTYAVTFRAECLLRGVDGDFMVAPMTAMRKAHLRDISGEIRNEINTGIRLN